MKLYNSACEDILKQIPDKSVDAVICDPPYGKLALMKWDMPLDWEVVCKELKRICKDKAPVLIFSHYKTLFNMQNSLVSNGLFYKYFFTWDKVTTINNGMQISTMPITCYEYILVMGCKKSRISYYTDAETSESVVKYNGAYIVKDKKIDTIKDMKSLIEATRRGEVIDDHCYFVCKKSGIYNGTQFAPRILQKTVIERPDDFVIYDDHIERVCTHYRKSSKMLLTIPNKDIGKQHLHPTQKPLELMKKLVSLYTKER